MEIIINENKKIVFRDSSALLPFSLKSITENFGTDHKKGDWDHSKTKGYSRALAEYCRLDCISLYEALLKFYDWPVIKRSGQAYTIASQAMRVQRTFFKKDLYALPKFATKFARPSYLGGRTEIFRPICKGKIYEYDVNSLYPFIMRDNDFPSSRCYNVFDFNDNKLGIYSAIVKAPSDLHVPSLGVLFRGKYIFPQGEFSGNWTCAELKYAKTLGYKIKIIRGICFDKKESLFKEFINKMYEIRKTSPKNSVSDIAAKLIMNASYGRYGLNPEKENISFTLKDGNKEFKDIKVNNKTIQLYKEPVELETFTHVAIASFVTSYSRIYMHKLMSKIKPDNLYYTDTDSIWTTEKMETGPELGQLKLEGEYEGAVFLLPKTYMATGFKNKIKMKGFDSKKIQDFTYQDFKNALEGDISRLKIINAPKFATLKQAVAQKKLVAMTKASTKQLKSKYDKRIIFKKSNELFTKPITLKECKNGTNDNEG